MIKPTSTRLVFVLILIVCLSISASRPVADAQPLEKRTNWYYHSISCAAQGLFAYFRVDQPIWFKVQWWGVMTAENGGFIDTADQAWSACNACQRDNKIPQGDCRGEVKSLLKMAIMNVVKVTVGWATTSGVNSIMVDGQNRRKRDLASTYHNTTLSVSSVLSNSGNTPLLDSLLSFTEVSDVEILGTRSLSRRNEGTDETVTIRNTTSGMVSDITHRQHNETCGTLFLSEGFVPPTYNSTSGLVSRDTPYYFPLCDGHIGLDYCANKEGVAGVYASGELDSMADSLADHWGSDPDNCDFYKMYTYASNGVDENWQLSFRTYYVSGSSDTIHWSQCDTGY